MGDTVWGQATHQCHEAWGGTQPDNPDQLWDVLTAMEVDEQMRLLAHCTALSLNALYEPAGRYNQGQVSVHGVNKRIASADHIARTIGLDMARAGWQPTVANYLSRVTKPRILEAVREARGGEMVSSASRSRVDSFTSLAWRAVCRSVCAFFAVKPLMQACRTLAWNGALWVGFQVLQVKGEGAMAR